MFHRSNLVGYILVILALSTSWSHVACADYKAALTKSLLFFEAQRSGKLPPNQRVQWRGDSGTRDGTGANVDLTGGYYDAGDNVKFGFPMAYAMTMLSWGVVEYGQELTANNELQNALDAIRWGTDYILKAHPEPNVLYGEVGDGDSDHACWQRPEEMTTPRTPFKIDVDHPGSDLAAETAAALAAASLAFRTPDPKYSDVLKDHAIQLFNFARVNEGLYSDSMPVASAFYKSSGFKDELLWAAAWLSRATIDPYYPDYLRGTDDTGDVRSIFSWDDKFVGLQILIAQRVLLADVDEREIWGQYKSEGEEFICRCIQKGSETNIQRSPGGLLLFAEWNNLQYTVSASFIVAVYSKYLQDNQAYQATLQCGDETVQPSDLYKFAQRQIDYILGLNPKQMSYMVGYGASYPGQVHHRGASIVSIKKDPTPLDCKAGFESWFYKQEPNPNVLDGAIVGGPDANDGYTDSRSNYKMAETGLVNVGPLVGILASLAAQPV